MGQSAASLRGSITSLHIAQAPLPLLQLSRSLFLGRRLDDDIFPARDRFHRGDPPRIREHIAVPARFLDRVSRAARAALLQRRGARDGTRRVQVAVHALIRACAVEREDVEIVACCFWR